MRNPSIKIPVEQKGYTVSYSVSGQLVGTVQRMGFGLWLLCCPICSACHVLPANIQAGQAYAPPCDRMATQHPTVYRSWQAAHPEAVGRTEVLLQYRQSTPAIIPLADDVPAVEREAA